VRANTPGEASTREAHRLKTAVAEGAAGEGAEGGRLATTRSASVSTAESIVERTD
jgi:hypothetical protein